MLRAIRQHKSGAAVLSAIVLLALASDAIAGVVCPHRLGSPACCISQPSHPHSEKSAVDSQADSHHMHVEQDQTSDTDMDHMAMAAEADEIIDARSRSDSGRAIATTGISGNPEKTLSRGNE